MSDERRSRSTEAFFGRRHGKTLRPAPTAALGSILPALAIDLATPAPDDLKSIFGVPVDGVRLEIGFGGGEHLHYESGRSPATGFIGVEPFVNGMASLALLLAGSPRQNLRLYGDDATRVLDWLPPASLDGIDLLYPDPWPKRRHWKRRFVNPRNVERFARVLKPRGVFRFASDIDHYVNWTLLHMRASQDFTWLATSAEDWREPYEGWQGTRYEAKARREGRTPTYLRFERAAQAA